MEILRGSGNPFVRGNELVDQSERGDPGDPTLRCGEQDPSFLL
jgi:hypothetical protein